MNNTHSYQLFIVIDGGDGGNRIIDLTVCYRIIKICASSIIPSLVPAFEKLYFLSALRPISARASRSISFQQRTFFMAIPAKKKHNGNFTIRSGSKKPGAMELWCQRRTEEAFHTEVNLGDQVLSRARTENAGQGPVRSADRQQTRGCDLVQLEIGALVSGPDIRKRAAITQQKTGRPVQFEISSDARGSLFAWLERRGGSVDDYVFPSRVDHTRHLSTRQYERLVDEWVEAIGLDAAEYGTHSLRRTKASIIYKATGNLRAIQILLAHSKI